MAAKRVDPLKAKEAKQKKIAIGGAVLLLALLAVQGPKTLKMLKGQPAPPVVTATAAPTTGTPAPIPVPGTTTDATAAAAAPAAATAELASVPDSDQAPVVDDGQLATFERFSTKDPFTQQAEPVAPPQPSGKPADKDPAAQPTKVAPPSASSGGDGTTTDEVTDGGGFTTGGSTPPASQSLAAATSIVVNGAQEDVTPEVPFPVLEPTFVLVSVADDGKSVQIGIAGGEYADGGETLKLLLGKKLTLQNTADGTRYELELVSVKGFPMPKQKR